VSKIPGTTAPVTLRLQGGFWDGREFRWNQADPPKEVQMRGSFPERYVFSHIDGKRVRIYVVTP
jgi:hypothetical protein